jgi:hypothetical protein
MHLPRILLVVTMIVAGGVANAVPTVGVGISFRGTSTAETGRGVYITEALSISVGTGAGDFTAGAWANGTSVATAVGSAGTVILGPQDGNDYETNICLPVENCPGI